MAICSQISNGLKSQGSVDKDWKVLNVLHKVIHSYKSIILLFVSINKNNVRHLYSEDQVLIPVIYLMVL